jgi:cytochrome c peroxidase
MTAPYMHDGTFATLEEVIDFYDQGGGPDPQRDVDLRPLGLDAGEKRALAAFLRALGPA